MRSFLRAHWKSVLAIFLLALLASTTLSAAAHNLAARLCAYVEAVASSQHHTANPVVQGLARNIETLAGGSGG